MTRNRTTLKQMGDLWTMAAPTEGTRQRRASATRQLFEHFGKDRRLSEVTEQEAREFAAKYPAATALRYAKQMFRQARRDGLIPVDPFRHLKEKQTQRTIEPPAADKLFAAARAAERASKFGRELQDFILVAAGTGLRISELCALELRDVKNGDDLRVNVRDGKGHKDRPGVLVLEPFGGKVCELALRRRVEVASARGPDVPGQPADERRLWLRPAESEGFYTRPEPWLLRTDVTPLWKEVRERVGLERCRFHDIRHFHATWLLDCGCTAEDVAIQLHGHPDPRTVVRIYGHPSHELARLRLRRLTQENGKR